MISNITPRYQQNINFQARYKKDNESLNKALRYSSAAASSLPTTAIYSQVADIDSIPVLYQLGDKIIELQKINGDGILKDFGRSSISIGESLVLPILGTYIAVDDSIIKDKDDKNIPS